MPSHFNPDEDRYHRYQRLMPKGLDLTLIILKGHLLIEEELDIFLQSMARAPQYLSQARLSFYQRLRLMQAVAVWPDGNVGNFVVGVGSLRNRLAHHAEVANPEATVDQLLATFFEEEYIQPKNPRERAKFLKSAFAFTIGTIHGHARAFALVTRKQQGRGASRA